MYLEFIILLYLNGAFGLDLKDQYFPYQHGRIDSKVTEELPKASGLFCDIKPAPLE